MKQWKLIPMDIELAGQMGRLHRGQGGDVPLHRHRRRAVDHGQVDDKKRARLNAMSTSCARCPINKDRGIVTGPDPLIVGSSAHVIGLICTSSTRRCIRL